MPSSPSDHLDLGVAHDWIDMERAARASGSRFAYLKGDLVLLELALLHYALGIVAAHGYRPVLPPVLVREEAMYGTGFFPADEQQIYRTTDGDCLVGTAEVPLAALHMDEFLEAEALPLRYAGYSACFRREAGAAGKDTRGILRVHQFDKLEMFSFCLPEQAEGEHELIRATEEEIFGGLGIPYRVVNIAAGDLGAPAAKKYDLEAWMPGQQRYREITSCSNCTDYQARRLNCRYRTDKGPRFVLHPERHGGRHGPRPHRHHRELPARRRHRRGAAGAGALPGQGDDRRLRRRGPRGRASARPNDAPSASSRQGMT